ncbi:uncharacterized protein PSFLO_01610 [Pseudozyma flocculosa]|nr:uncharacterized protein PSFLO_01610 [Pseudozyma flocculosa]
MSSTSSSARSSPARPRFEVEIYAHALKARLELASFKAINGLGKANIDDLERSADLSSTMRAVAPSPWQPSQPTPSGQVSAALQSSATDGQGSSSPSKTPDLVRDSKAATAATKAPRSIYADIFGKDFGRDPPLVQASPVRATDSRAKATVPSVGRNSSQSTPSSSRLIGTSSLLDKAASSPQLGSPERRNGRFDWHNNPSAEMKAREQELAASGHHFEVPAISPTKRVRLTSAAGALLASPRRARMHSSGNSQAPAFLPNGHLASSLAQGLGISAPRTPRSRYNSAAGRQAVPHLPPGQQMDQDQEERDRVASTLAMMAEDRAAAKQTDSSGSGGSSSGGGGSERQALPATPRKGGFADPGSITPVRAGSHRGHRRNVSWANPSDSLHAQQRSQRQHLEAAQPDRPKTPERRINDDDEGAAHYLLYLASSPSPAGATRSTARFEGATPSLHPLRSTTGGLNGLQDAAEPTNGSVAPASSNESDSPSSEAAKRKRDSEGRMPITPPSSGRARHQRNPLRPLESLSSSDTSDQSSHQPPQLGSPPRTPPRTAAPLPRGPDVANASSALYDWSGDAAPKTPPPLMQPHTPQAPGSEFSYAEFVNVSPSPKPRTVGRTPGTSGRAWTDAHGLGRAPTSGSGADGTPSRGTASRGRFLHRYDDEWNEDAWDSAATTLTPGPAAKVLARHSRTSSSASIGSNPAPARTLDFD